MVTTVGGHLELRAAALLKAVWWRMHLASLLTHLFVFCTVMDFSAAEKGRGVKICTCVGLLSGQVFSPFVNFGSRGVTGAAALLLGCMAPVDPVRRMGIRNWGRRRCIRPDGGICVL